MSLEWKSCKIGDLGKIFSGGTPSTKISEYWGGDLNWLSSGETRNTYIYTTDKFITEEGANNSSTKLASKGDIVIASAGQGFTRGQSSMVMIDTYVNQSVIVISPNEKVNNHYLLYNLKFRYPELRQLSDHASTRGSLTTKIIKGLEINLPDLNTQNKIATIIQYFDKKIENNKRINKNLLSIADAVFKKEFRNFDDYSEDELITSDFGLIPADWHYKTLNEISDVAIGKTPPRKETEWFSEKEGIKWVSIKDLGNSGTYVFETSEYLTEEAIEKFNVKLIPEDTVILSFKLTVGRLGITTEEMVTNEAIAHFKLDENSLISKEYLYLYLKNFNYEELGSTSSIAKAINSKIVKKIPVLIPTNNKLNEFKELFENIFNEIKNNQLEINKLTKLRDTLLPKLMSGEIDVSKINCDLKYGANNLTLKLKNKLIEVTI
ncbi:MAG: restriction endonuclease subunit S [Methanobrevibacter sp.]|nr:restriction endonuclease subunit S [Methanobrevibacter sp.]